MRRLTDPEAPALGTARLPILRLPHEARNEEARKASDAGVLRTGPMHSVLSFRLLPIAFLLAATSPACSSSASSSPAGDSSAAGSLRSVDVTVVYPLPVPGEEAALLGPADVGRGGQPLLMADAFDQGRMPDLDERAPIAADAERLASLRVVAVRFDPCPGVILPPSSGTTCQPDIRLVFQSLRVNAGTIEARDGAVHAFYRLPRNDWATLLEELRAIRREDEGTTTPTRLDVHPRLRVEGPSGPYATQLKKMVTRFASTENLVRVTHFRRVDSSFPKWEFVVREVASGTWSGVSIATTGVPTQTLATISGGRWDAVIEPAVKHPDDVTVVFKQSSTEAMKKALVPVARVLNPRIHSSESVDCASCHIATDVAAFVRSTQNLSVSDLAERFQSTYSTDAASKSDDEAIAFDNIHMLSYAGRSLSITPRVANETAAVLETVNARQ
jgi:hypothetical protein